MAVTLPPAGSSSPPCTPSRYLAQWERKACNLCLEKGFKLRKTASFWAAIASKGSICERLSLDFKGHTQQFDIETSRIAPSGPRAPAPGRRYHLNQLSISGAPPTPPPISPVLAQVQPLPQRTERYPPPPKPATSCHSTTYPPH